MLFNCDAHTLTFPVLSHAQPQYCADYSPFLLQQQQSPPAGWHPAHVGPQGFKSTIMMELARLTLRGWHHLHAYTYMHTHWLMYDLAMSTDTRLHMQRHNLTLFRAIPSTAQG